MSSGYADDYTYYFKVNITVFAKYIYVCFCLSRLSAFAIRVFSKGRHCGGKIDPKLLRQGVDYLCRSTQERSGDDLGRFVEKSWWYLDYRMTWIKVTSFKTAHVEFSLLTLLPRCITLQWFNYIFYK